MTMPRYFALFAASLALVLMSAAPVCADIPPDDPNEPYRFNPPPHLLDAPDDPVEIETPVTDPDASAETKSSGENAPKRADVVVEEKKAKKGCGLFSFAEITIFLIVVAAAFQLKRLSKEPPKEE